MRLVEKLPSCFHGKGTVDIDTLYSKDQSCLRVRYLTAFFCFMANAVYYIMRVNLSVGIVAMTFDDDGNPPDGPPDAPVYDWSSSQQSTILSSFFWGYIVAQVPAGYLVQRFGPRMPFFISLVLSSIATMVYVPLASLGWEYACASRVVLGFVQGPLIPVSVGLVSRWSLPGERGRMITYTYTGQQFGTVVAMSTSGIIAAEIGWPNIFYINGIIGIVLAIFWLWLVRNMPSQHNLISPHELELIEASIAAVDGEEQVKQKVKTPWLAFLTSIPFIALVIVHCAQNWGFFTLLTEIPTYMSGVYGFDLAQNGLLSALPYLVMWIFGLILSWVSDWMLKKKYYSVGTSRKLGNSLAHYGSAISLIVLAYVDAGSAGGVAILTVAVGISAGTMIGYQVNYIDLSPNFASILAGMSGVVSCVFSIVGPLVVGFIVTDQSDVEQWRIVFLTAAAIYIVGNTIFVIFGSGEVQPWNSPDWKPKKKNSSHSDNDSKTS